MTAKVHTNDPNVKIPAAIKALGARSEALHNQIYASATPPAEPEAPAVVTPETPAEAAPPIAATPPAAPATPPAEPATPVDWEHRYNSMKGRYDRSQDEIRNMGDQISELQRAISALQLQKPAAPAPASARPAERLVTPEEENDYGAELLTVVGKRAKEEFSPLVNELKAEIDGLKDQLASVGGHVATDNKQRMYDTLDERLPEWRELNREPEFISWLRLPDPLSGVIRQNMLMAAYERHDAPRVLAFFKGFLSTEAATAPSGGLDPSIAPPQPAAQPQVQLSDLAAPGRARTAAPGSAPAEKPSFTRAQIAKFYADVRTGAYRGRDAEKVLLEKQIFEAGVDGRILS